MCSPERFDKMKCVCIDVCMDAGVHEVIQTATKGESNGLSQSRVQHMWMC